MNHLNRNGTILMVDDDPDDFSLARDAFHENGLQGDFRLVSDGQELMDYLYRHGKFRKFKKFPLPSLILLDLNMPGKDGREALMEIKKDPDLRRIPVVIFTTSQKEEDISCCYELGASSFITKPASFDDLVNVMSTLGEYWLNMVRLPGSLPENMLRQARVERMGIY
jgi:CheY-like chemotaxis protein